MADGELTSRFETAQTVAREAGALALAYFRDLGNLDVQHKGLQDPVSEADRAVETLIRERVQARHPGDTVLGEEYGGTVGDTVWVVDPIDGTANFVHGIPLFGVSIALVRHGRLELGVVYAPVQDELFATRRGGGARLDGQALRVNRHGDLSGALLTLGFNRRRPLDYHLRALGYVLENRGEYRRLGSAALALAYTAAGRLDGFFDGHAHSWDVLAGLLLVREAGGWTNDFLAGDGLSVGNPVAACAAGLREHFLAMARLAEVEMRE